MSEKNVELVYRAADAVNRGDLEAFLVLCDPDVEFISRIVALEGGRPYQGHDGVRRWWENVFAVFPDFSGEIEEVVRDLGDVTVVRVRVRGHGRHGMESDVPMEETQWHVNEWREGKTIRWRPFVSESEALEAAGLSE